VRSKTLDPAAALDAPIHYPTPTESLAELIPRARRIDGLKDERSHLLPPLRQPRLVRHTCATRLRVELQHLAQWLVPRNERTEA
jgi:hypothetical protein